MEVIRPCTWLEDPWLEEILESGLVAVVQRRTASSPLAPRKPGWRWSKCAECHSVVELGASTKTRLTRESHAPARSLGVGESLSQAPHCKGSGAWIKQQVIQTPHGAFSQG